MNQEKEKEEEQEQYIENVTKSNYIYKIKEKANRDIIINEITTPKLDIICYHVTEKSAKYPFIQIMVELDRYKQQFVLPCVYISSISIDTNLSDFVLNKIKYNLEELGCDTNQLSNDAFIGLINNNTAILVDISSVDIFRISNSRMNNTWFALPTEIMNKQKICNIEIDDKMSNLFCSMPELCILHKLVSSIETYDVLYSYPLPDAVYTGSHFKQVEFNSLFGVPKKQVYKSCGEYYYFYQLFEDAVIEGGWDNSENINEKLIDNGNGRYIKGGINRYALFPGNYMSHIEKTKKFSLTDDIINGLLGTKDTIVIQYENEDIDTILPDLLVKSYESFCPISYHILNKNILGNNYEIDKQNQYMVL
jgi:hypothetical protein